MAFDSKFWNKIKNIIKLYHLNFLFDTIGKNYLSEDELDFLEKNLGKTKLNEERIPLLDKIFAFGQIAEKIGIINANKITKKDLDDFLKKNKLKINQQLERIKSQAYLDVLSKQFQIEKDLRQQILNKQNENKELKISDIYDFIKNKFEDWSFLKDSISYVSESALNQGKAEEIRSKSEEKDPIVYKVPIQDEKLCPNCRKAYLKSDGSPKLFKLSELEDNGTNIGKKTSEWLPTLGQLHPHCYDKKTKVFTDEGWKFFKDLRGDELCLTFNIETKKEEWSSIKHKISYYYEGKMHLYKKIFCFNLCITPEHTQIVIDNNKIIKETDNNLPNKNNFILVSQKRFFNIYNFNFKKIEIERQVINYNDYVYCVEVEKNNTLFVKRKGHITISGNCRCLLQYFETPKGTSQKDYEWSEDKQRYILKEKVLNDTNRKVQRKSKVKITIGTKEFEV